MPVEWRSLLSAGANSVLAKGRSWNARNPWETAPIHLHHLLAPRLDALGIADRDRWVCATALLSRRRLPPPANAVYTYPGNGTRHRFREIAADRPYAPGQRVGIPKGRRTGPYLYVMPDGPGLGPVSQARITAASLAGPTGPVPLRPVDNFTTGLVGLLPPGGQLIPERPLRPATTYTATVAMSVLPAPGATPVPFDHRWSFTTFARKPRRPGLRLVGRSSRGWLVRVLVRTRRGGRGRAGLKVRRCARTRGRTRCDRRHRVRVRVGRSGSLHRLSVRLPRRGRWALRPLFRGSHGWGDGRSRG